MQNRVIFSNPGEMDLRSISLFGVSVKDKDNPIGFFGTGFKYGLAVLLRNFQTVTIYSGLKRIEFSIHTDTFRGKEIELVRMHVYDVSGYNDPDVAIHTQELGFDVSLGKNWKMWMAYRELYCNCKDEGGTVHVNDVLIKPQEGWTYIIVDGAEFFHEHEQREQFIIESRPVWFSETIEFHQGHSQSLYYKTIKVADTVEPTAYRYNFLPHLELTEDRTAKYDYIIEQAIRDAVVTMNDKDMIHTMLTWGKEGCLEQSLNYNYFEGTISDAFVEVVQQLAKDENIKYNTSAKILVERHLRKAIRPSLYSPDDVEKIQLAKAIDFCKFVGFEMEYPIMVYHSLGEEIHGRADMKAKQIMLAREAFGMGTKYLAVTILEEHIHLKYGHPDCSRRMQNFLFNLIGTLGERLKGEPL